MNIYVPKGATKQRKRVGRGPGSGWGCTAGRGTKGQKSRSGGGVRPGFEGGQMPLYRRIPRRGFSNYPFKRKPVIISIAIIKDSFSSGDEVSLKTLSEKNIIKKTDDFVKILGNEPIDKALTFLDDVYVSKTVYNSIISAGGSAKKVPCSLEKEKLKNKKDTENKGDNA